MKDMSGTASREEPKIKNEEFSAEEQQVAELAEQFAYTQKPEELSRYKEIQAYHDSAGRRRIRGTYEDSDHHPDIAADDVLKAYGYSPDEAKQERAEERARAKAQNTPKAINVVDHNDTDEEGGKDGGSSKELSIRSVKDGELEEEHNQDNPESEDHLPVGAMAHEPWAVDINNSGKETGQAADEAGDTSSSQDTSAETEIDNEKLEDGFKQIGGVVEDRIDELQSEGKSEADAHAEAHDEFWGRNEKPSDTDGEGGEDGGEDGEEPEDDKEQQPTPETITSPELEAAKVKLDAARTELARLRAGRESATFFSRKFSKKKLDEAFAAYEEAKAEAGSIAVDLLREHGFTGQDLLSAINFGSMEEAVLMISEQYEHEKSSLEGKRLRGFYEWWNKQGTKIFSLGTVKKGAVMALIGAPIGAAVGVAGIVAAPVVGAGLAAGAGVAAARGISKGLVGNVIRKNANAATVAEAKAHQRHIEAQQLIDSLEATTRSAEDDFVENYVAQDYGYAVGQEITGQARRQTTETKRGNDRRALISGAIAAGAGALAAIGVDRLIDAVSPEPAGPVYSPNADRFQGILDSRPGAPADAQRFFESIEPGTQPSPELNQIDQIWDSVKDQLSPEQDRIYNQVIGRLSATEGNGYTIQNADRIFDLVREGNNVDQVIAQLNAAAQTT